MGYLIGGTIISLGGVWLMMMSNLGFIGIILLMIGGAMIFKGRRKLGSR